ncbi:hypothetical protein Elgi_24500 [Paenibacillus elgii]|uniref:hypothetical protein n=1 Tax=Paenibacillus elgii TaxID=189691 RepID=UPI002D7B77C5|nr:hypothetical protein Elgi_24500 [Paenibacillus elgii]
MSREQFLKVFSYKKPYFDVWVNDVHWILQLQEVYVQKKPEVGNVFGIPTSSLLEARIIITSRILSLAYCSTSMNKIKLMEVFT